MHGDIGFGESYVDGDWETDNLTSVIKWFLLNIDNAPSISGSKRKLLPVNFLKTINRISHLVRSNTIIGSKKNISAHYDLNNEFFSLFLDSTMTYSSAYFKGRSPLFHENYELEQAQKAKYERLCRIMQLQSTDHILEIGSGWGGFAFYAAKNYGCKVTTITISKEQFEFVEHKIAEEGLTNKIEIRLEDYRNITGEYDKIISIEMLEAVGHKFLKTYFKKCQQLLKKNGMLGLQVITCPDSRYDSLRKSVDWIQKHIFPGSLLPSIGAINDAIHKTGNMFLYDVKDFGIDYSKTLAIWKKNFNQKLSQVRELGFDEIFIRKWNYYLSYCEAAFAMKNISVVQMVYTRPNNVVL